MTCESVTKPSCDWSDPDARSELVDGLVTDGLRLIEAVEGVKLDPDQADALGLLGVVTGQDVEPDPDREGRWRIARRVAADRTISTVDPEARHGHKTRTRKRDGYKAHVATEPETGLVTAAVLTAANTPDADSIGDIVADQPPRSRNRRRFGVRVRCGSRNVRRSWSHPGGETNRTQTPHRRRVPPRRLLYRHRNPDGDVSRPPHHPYTSRRYRPIRQMVQRLPPAGTMHHLEKRTDHQNRQTPRPSGGRTRPAGPKKKRRTPTGTCGRPQNGPSPGSPATEPDAVPYRGLAPNQQWLTTPTAAINLQRLINLGPTHTTTGWATNPA